MEKPAPPAKPLSGLAQLPLDLCDCEFRRSRGASLFRLACRLAGPIESGSGVRQSGAEICNIDGWHLLLGVWAG